MSEPIRPGKPGGGLIQVRLLDDIALVTFTRPDVLNALNEALLSQSTIAGFAIPVLRLRSL